MPPAARKASGGRLSGGRQATLSFHHRVTKPTSAKQSVKEAALSVEKKIEKEATPETRDIKVEEPAKTAAKTEKEPSEEPAATEEEEIPPPHEPAAVSEPPAPEPRPDIEIEAEAVSQARIRRYWQSIEAQRTARRVHQSGLDLGEKILRYFDVSSQFGPCVGISRKKRWMRAQRLGLEPPIEVLAVLLMEESKGVEDIEQASIDRILNPAVAA